MENQPPKIAPHLITDTGVWRLTVEISDHNLMAWIRRNDDPDEPVYLLADAAWTGDQSLRNVENAVYDHPLVLDDFEADIIIDTPKFIFLPAECGHDVSTCRNAFAMIFGDVAEEDLFIDCIGDYVCIYMLMPGLKPFLIRTFAGSRISAEISILLRHWMENVPQHKVIFADVFGNTVNIAAFNEGKLINAVQRKFASSDDLLYYVAATSSSFSPSARLDSISLCVSGEEDQVIDNLSPYALNVMDVSLPYTDQLSQAALLCSYRKPLSL